jgi:DNA repair exonuclease SbcCD ATPase subunit
MGQGELEKCLEELVKSGRGWVVRNGYLVNKVIVRDIMNEEKRRIENEIKKIEEDLNILRQEADTIEEIRRLWIENPLLKGEWSPKVMLSVYTIWSEKLNTVFGKVKDREEELKRLKNLIEEINTRIEGSFVE